MTLPTRSLLLLTAVLALSGCSYFNKSDESVPCPRVSALSDSAQMTRFRPGAGHDATDVALQAELISYHGSCRYDAEKKKITIEMKVGIEARRGPAAQGRGADLSYFVAIPAFYPDPKGKVVLPVAIEFPENTNAVRYTDNKLEVTFPVSDVKDMAKYELFVGLQLDQSELDYNRRRKGTN